MTAQRLLVERGDHSVAPALRAMAASHTDDRARLHALWTLDGLGDVDARVLRGAMKDQSAYVRAAAIRISEPMLRESNNLMHAEVMRLIGDRAPVVRRQLAASLGELPVTRREAALLDVVSHHGDDPIVADLVVTGLAGHELSFLERLLASQSTAEPFPSNAVQSLSSAIVRSGNARDVQRVRALAAQAKRPNWQHAALLAGLQATPNQRGGATAPARPLTPAEQARFAAGQKQYGATCAGCHQMGGTGLAGVAKTLVGSPWATGIPPRLIRIVLQGKEGEMLMPPVGGSMTDDQIAAVLTYIRRSWGNAASPISPDDVREVRGATMGRTKPWTEAELSGIRR
jgi:mono/diheme cytochrome c family protein